MSVLSSRSKPEYLEDIQGKVENDQFHLLQDSNSNFIIKILGQECIQ